MNTLAKPLSTLLIPAALVASLMTTPAFAKDGGNHKRGPNIERMAEKLALSEAQTVAFTEIMEAQMEKRQSLRESVKAQREALRAETLSSLQTILDEEQLAKIEKMMERGKKHRHER